MKKRASQIYSYIRADINRALILLLVFTLPFERIPSVEVLGASIRPSVLVGIAIILRTLYLIIRKKLRPGLNFQEKLLIAFLAPARKRL